MKHVQPEKFRHEIDSLLSVVKSKLSVLLDLLWCPGRILHQRVQSLGCTEVLDNVTVRKLCLLGRYIFLHPVEHSFLHLRQLLFLVIFRAIFKLSLALPAVSHLGLL